MSKKIKKVLSVLLIVAMTITNAGFSVLAESVDSVITDEKNNQEEVPNYYYELEYEKETIVEEFESILEKQNPGVLDDESEGEEFEEDVTAADEDAEDILFEEEPEEEFKESEEETEKESEENISEKESFEEEALKEDVKESSNESKEEKTSESEEKPFDVEEIVASESNIDEEAPINIDEEEATESETFKENELEEAVEEKISTESEILERKNEEATKSEVEKEKVVEEEVVASESEVEYATKSEVSFATESEVEATISETKEVVYATISKTIWKVKRFLLDDVSETQVKTSEEENERMSRLATNANVILINDNGEEKVINIPIKWKLIKDIEVNAVGGVDEAAIPVEVLHEKFNVKEVIKEVNKGHIYSTVNEAWFIDKAKEASEELGKEIIIVEEKASESVVVEKVFDGEVVEETKPENSNETKEEEPKVLTEEEKGTDERSNDEIYDETGFSEEELKEIIEEESVAAFSETEETSTVSEAETVSETMKEEVNEETNNQENAEEETSTYSNLPTASGLTSTFAVKDRVKDYYDLRNIYLYTIDTEEASKEIMNAINVFSDEEEKEVKTDAEKEEDDDVKSFFDSLFGFFFGNKGTESNEESSNKESSDTSLFNEKYKNNLSMLFSNPNIDVLDSTPSMPMVMMNAMRFGAGVDHKHSHKYFDDNDTNEYINLTSNVTMNTSVSLDFVADWDNGEDGKLTDGVTGTYALGANTTLHNRFQLSTGSTLTICLNGFTLKFATSSYIFGDGTVNIVNCDGEGHVKTSEPQKNWRDQFFATTNETYTKYNERGPFSVSKINIIGDACDDTDSKIVFENCQVKNLFAGKSVKNKMFIVEDDLPEIGGGGSLINASEKAQVYKTKFKNNMATRSNGVAINSFLGSLVVDECEFDGNKNLTNRGGAIVFNPGATIIHNSIFKNNTAETFGGALYGRQYTNMSVPISGGTKIIGSTFENNRALREGGALSLDYFTDVTIGGDSATEKTTFKGNVAGGMGGAIAIVHINSYDSKEAINWDQQTTNLGTLNIKNSEFKQNEAHALKKGSNHTLVDDPNCENHIINYGGALYVNNRDINNQDGTVSGDRIIQGPTVLQKINIEKSSFEENKAVGEKMFASTNSNTSLVAGDIEYHFNNYGGAAYIKGVENVNVTGSKFTNNQSMTGGTFCISEKTNLNIGADTEIKGGSGLENMNDYLAIDSSDPNEHKKAKIENLLITPAGGAVYVMNASASIAEGAKITENFNAIYLAKGDVDLGSTEVNGNIGEYLIGFTNDLTNQILFNGVNIKGNKFYGSGKNYTELNAAHMAVKNSYIAFKAVNTIKENREVSAKNDNGNGAEGTEVNIDLRSSISNIKLDLSKYSFRVNKDGEKGKIGLHFDIDETTTSEIDPDTGQELYVHDKEIVVPNWDGAHAVIFNEGGIWTNFFTLDNSQLGGTTWDSNWKFYTKDANVRISPNIFTVKFETYFDDEEIEEQFYNYKRGSGEYIKLATPMEVTNADGSLTKRTFVGFLGQNRAIGAVDPEKWVVWDFENHRMKASRDVDEGVLIAVYSDDTVKVKACGCDIGTTCDHIDGSNHIDRGIAATNDRLKAAYQNYVIIATPVHLAYRYNNQYKTQFTLKKDMTLTTEELNAYNAKDIVLNLNGKTLTVLPSDDKNAPFIGSTKFSSYSNAVYPGYGSETGIFISGKASSSQATRGKIKIQGSHNNAFIDAAGLNVYIKDVDFEDIDAGTNDCMALFTSTGSSANLISFEDVTFNNIKLNNDLINGFDNVYVNRVETKENIELAEHAFVRGKGASVTPTPSTIIKESKIKNIKAKDLFDADISAVNGTREINISTSSITNNTFTHSLVDFTNPGFSGSTCISFDGKIDIKENEVTGSGTELINLGNFDWNPGVNSNADVTISDNVVPAVNENTIIRAEGTGKLYINDGKLIITGNKAVGGNTTAEISALTISPTSKVIFGSGSAKINENNTKYNFLIDNDIASSVSNVFDLRAGKKLKSEDTNIKIRLKDSTLEQKLFNNWNETNVEGTNLPENVFDQDPSYNNDPEPIKNTKSYKWTQGGMKEVHFGKEYVTGSFKLYNYVNDGQDERVAHPDAYDHAIAEENEQRLRRNAITDLDKPTVTPPVGSTYIWEGLYYKDDNDATKEEYYGTDISALTIKAEKNFEISGYISHNHSHTGEDDMVVEVRNEGHIQATTSKAYLHNDLHITRPLTKLTGDFTLCLNGHKLIIDKNLTWIDAFNGNNITIENCSWNPEGSIAAKDSSVIISTPFIAARNGAKLNVKNISINNIKATESFIDVKVGAKLNVDKLLIDNVEADYTGNTDEQSFIETNGANVNNATYSNIKITNSKIYGPNVEEKKEFIRIKSKTSEKLTLDGFKLSGNTMKGDAYLVRAIADSSDIDINNFEIINNTNELLGDPSNLIHGTSLFVKGDNKDVNIRSSVFNENKITGDTTVMPSPTTMESNYPATIMFGGDVANLKIQGSEFKNNLSNAASNWDSVTTALQVEKNVKNVVVKDTIFDNNNQSISTQKTNTKAIILREIEKVDIENTIFTGGNKDVEMMHIDYSKNTVDGKVTFKNGTKFTDVKANNAINISSNGKGQITFDGIEFNNNEGTNVIYIGGGAKVIASNSVMKGSKATEIRANDFSMIAPELTLTNFIVENAGDADVNHEAIHAGAIKKITINEKIVIKGHKKNLVMSKNIYDGTITQLEVGSGHKLLDGSEIYMTALPDDAKFFTQWNKNYIEKYETTELSNGFSYHPSKIFKYDDVSYLSYREGVSNLYSAKNTSTNYATLKYVDEEVQGTATSQKYITEQYVKVASVTTVDHVQVDYVSTTSQVWMAQVLSGGGIATWRVKNRYTVNVPTSGVHLMKLTKMHIHLECGCEYGIEPCVHMDGSVHTDEYEFIKVSDDSAFTDPESYYFGLDRDVIINQVAADAIKTKAALLATPVVICLNGHNLTFGDGVTFESAGGQVVFVNCCDTGAIKTVSEESDALIKQDMATGTGMLKFYNIVFDGCKVHTATMTGIVKVNKGNIYAENLKFINCVCDYDSVSTRTAMLDIQTDADASQNYLANISFEGNITKIPALLLAGKYIDEGHISTISFIGNTYGNGYGSSLFEVFTPSADKVKIKKLYLEGNKSTDTDEDSSMVYIYGNPGGGEAILEVEEELVVKGNIVKGKLFDMQEAAPNAYKHSFVFDKDVTILQNTAEKGIININHSQHKYVFKGNLLAKDNNGSVINGSNMNVSSITFEKNVVFDGNSSNEAVIVYDGTLDLKKATFKNHGTACSDIIKNRNAGDIIKLASPTFINNNVSGNIMNLYKVGVGSEIYGINDETNGNKGQNFLLLDDSSNLVFRDSTFKGNTFTKAGIKISTPGNVIFKNINVADNTTAEGAISIAGGKVEIQDEVKIYGNPSTGGLRDIYIADDDAYVYAATETPMTSRLSFYPYKAGIKVYEGWVNKDPDTTKTDTRQYMITPENCGVFPVAGKAQSENYNIYRKGTSADEKEIYMGKENQDFVTITFIYDEETPHKIYGYQNIAKDVETTLSKVDAGEGIDITKQYWEASSSGVTDSWNFASTATASVSISEKARYQKPHIHGLEQLTPVANLAQINGAGAKFVVLKADIELTNVTNTSLKGICLNGHKLTIRGNDGENPLAAFNIGGDFEICDCKSKGYITMKDGETRYGDIFKVTNGTTKISVPFKNMSIKASGSNTGHIIEVNVGGMSGAEVLYEYATISNVTIDSVDGLIKVTGGTTNHYVTITDMLLTNNTINNGKLLDNTKVKIAGDLTVKDNTFNTKEGMKLNNTSTPFTKVTIDNNTISSTEQDSYIVDMENISISNDLVVTNNKETSEPADKTKFIAAVKSNNTHISGDVLFENNKFKAKGAGLVVDGTTNAGYGLKVDGNATFRNNESNNGSGAYIEHIFDDGTLVIAGQTTFDNNKVAVAEAGTSGIQNAVFVLASATLSDVIFKNHVTAADLISQRNMISSPISISSVSFINNNTTGEAMHFESFGDIIIKDVKAQNSKFKTFLGAKGTNVEPLRLENSDLSGAECTDVTVYYEEGGLSLKDVKIENKDTSKTSLRASAINKYIDIQGNINIGKTELSNNVYFNAAGMISSTSNIVIKSAQDGSLIYKSWDAAHIAMFDSHDESLSDTDERKYMYTPENSGLFTNEVNTAWNFYKAKTVNPEVHIGSQDKYVEVTFKYIPSDTALSQVIYGTQHISKSSPSRFDKVDMLDYEFTDQEWHKPTGEDTELLEKFNPDMIATYNNVSSYDIKLEEKHVHKVCGLKRSETCAHDGHNHTETRAMVYKEVHDLSELASVEYAELENDIVVESSLNLGNVKGLCLNGHRIIFNGTNSYNSSFLTLSHDVDICDCKCLGENADEHGAIAFNPANVNDNSKRQHSDFIKTQNHNLGLYNMYFEGTSITNYSTTIKGSLINANNGVAYLEKVRIASTTHTSDDGLLKTSGTGKIYMRDVTIKESNTRGNSAQAPMITLTANMIISTLSIIDNKDNGPATNIPSFVEISGNVTIDKLIFRNNEAMGLEQGLIGIKDGNTLTLKEDVEIEGNNISGRGAINLGGLQESGADINGGTLKALKKIIFKNNNSNSTGGALYAIGNTAKVRADGGITFIGNSAENGGGAIYGKNITEDTFGTTSIIFENNTVGVNSDPENVLKGIVQWTGTLKLEKPEFINHTDTKTSLIKNDGSADKLILIDPVFKNNNLVRDAIYLTNAQDGSKISGMDEKSIGNTFYNFIDLQTGKLTLDDGSISGIKSQDSLINVGNSAELTISSVSITNNNTNKAAVYINGNGEAKVVGKIDISGNKDLSGAAGYDIRLSDNTAKLSAAGTIDKDSKLTISADTDSVVFEDWNNSAFEKYDNPDMDVENEVMYTPESSGIFIAGKGNESHKFYISGDTSANKKVKLGVNYAVAKFINKKTDEPDKVYGTQYVEKNTDVMLDKVDTFEYELTFQEWHMPDEVGGYNTTLESFARPGEMKVNYNPSDATKVYEILYEQKHYHKECGLNVHTACNHDPAVDHTASVEWKKVESVADINDVNNKYAGLTVERIFLDKDILVDSGIISIPVNIKGLCLNGHTITMKHPGLSCITANNDFTITNCCDEGGIAGDNNVTLGAPLVNITSGELKMYNTAFKNVTSNASYIKVNNTAGDAYLENVRFEGNKNVGATGMIEAGHKVVASKLIFKNNNIVGNNALINITDNLEVATLSVINNTLKGNAVNVSVDYAGKLKYLEVLDNITTGEKGIIYVANGKEFTVDSDSLIKNNKAINGGAFYVEENATLKLMHDLILEENSADKGGAIYVAEGGKIDNSSNSPLTFIGNKAKNGSAIYISGSPSGNINLGDKTTFKNEESTETGIITFYGDLSLDKVTFENEKANTVAFITKMDGNEARGYGNLTITNITLKDNSLSKNADVISAFGSNVTLNGLTVENTDSTKKNNFKNFINAGDDSFVQIQNTTISNATYEDSVIKAKNVYEVRFNNSAICDNTMKGSAIDLINSKATNTANFTIKNNKTTGAKGAAITIDADSEFVADGEKLMVTENTSVGGGAIYNQGKFTITDKETTISGNKTSVANGKAKDLFMANPTARIVAGANINGKSKIALSVANDNQLVFEDWDNARFNPYGTTYSKNPDIVFVSDEFAKNAKQEIYKTGLTGSQNLKFGTNFVKLTFQNANKTSVWSKQNIEKNAETSLDEVKISNVSNEKWIFPANTAAENDQVRQFTSPLTAKYSSNQAIIKSFKYNVVYTAGSKEGIAIGNVYGHEDVEYGTYITLNPNNYTVDGATFTKWSLRSAPTGQKADYQPGEQAKNLCDVEGGTAYVDARWTGEAMARFYGNGDRMGIGIAYNNLYNKLVTEGTSITLNKTYPADLATSDFEDYTTYNTKPDGTGTTYNVGQVITLNADIDLYCMWKEKNPSPIPVPPPPVPPTPTPRRESSGSGGGGGSGVIKGPAKAQNQLPGKFSMNADGFVVDSNGNVVGHVSFGDHIDEFGNWIDGYGNRHNPDGSITNPLGLTFNLDGSITDANGVTYLPDGTIVASTGNRVDANGVIHRADGSIVAPDGTIYHTDGSVEFPDGTILLPTGDVQKIPAETKDTKATIEFNPTISKWQFFTINTDGSKEYQKDKWVKADNNKGKETWYIADSNGNMVTGWVKIEGEYYFMSTSDENKGEVVTGTINVDGKTYTLDQDGKLLGSEKPKNMTVIGAVNHTAGVDGNWKKDASGGTKFYQKAFDEKGKEIEVPVSGWFMIDGSYYFFGDDNYAKTGLIEYDGKYYYLQKDGTMMEGGEIEIDGIVYSFDKATGACRSALKK